MTVHCALLFLRWTSETAVYTESAQRRGVAFTHSVTVTDSGQSMVRRLHRYVLTSAAISELFDSRLPNNEASKRDLRVFVYPPDVVLLASLGH